MTFGDFQVARRVPLIACLAGVIAASGARADVIYVSNSGNNAGNSNTIEKINSAGVGSVFASTGLSQPTGLAFDSAGNLYVANYNINTIEKFTPNGVGSLFASTGLNHPYDLAFDHQGNLFAANSGNDTIEKFTSGGVGSLFASTSPGSPNGLAVDAQDNVYAGGNDTIEKFTPGGVGSVFASVGDPFGLAFGPDGYLYVSQNHTTITRISPTGGALGLTTNFVFRGIAFDSGGNLVGPVDSNIFLGMVTSGGANSGLLVSGLNGAQFIAIETPEPSSFLLAITSLIGSVVCGYICERFRGQSSRNAPLPDTR